MSSVHNSYTEYGLELAIRIAEASWDGTYISLTASNALSTTLRTLSSADWPWFISNYRNGISLMFLAFATTSIGMRTRLYFYFARHTHHKINTPSRILLCIHLMPLWLEKARYFSIRFLNQFLSQESGGQGPLHHQRNSLVMFGMLSCRKLVC